MSTVNKVILIGNLGTDPSVKTSEGGKKIVTLSLATGESWNDRASGERRQRTEWHRVTIFNEHFAGVAERYLRKGGKVYVEGSLQTQIWTDQTGQERFTTQVVIGAYRGELVLLGSPRGDDAEGTDSGDGKNDQGNGAPNGGGHPPGDDIPYAACWQ